MALRLLGQASNYSDDVRRAYNDRKRDVRALLASKDDASHVLSYCYEKLKEALRKVRSKRGHLLDWGTYQLIEAAQLAADKATGLDPIQRVRWDGTGRIGAFIASVDKFPANEWNESNNGRTSLSRAKGSVYGVLKIRVSDLESGRAIHWPIKLHRNFPKGAIVKQVAVQRIRVGSRYRWEALITLSYEPVNIDLSAKGHVGVDIGWRGEDGRAMRVATHDGKGDKGWLCIDTYASYEYCDAVRGIRDLNFDLAKEYIANSGMSGGEHARLWKDKDRITRIARYAGANDLGVAMWLKRDRHLQDIECGTRARAMRRRLDAFKVYANALATRYKIVVLEDMPMSEWVGNGKTSALERKRSIANLYQLQLIIANRFGEGRVDWVPPEYTSMTCSACGKVKEERVGPEIFWTCTSCGTEHHQDENAALNLRRIGERWSAEGKAVRARTRKTAKRKGEKKKDAIATGDERKLVVTARKPPCNAAE